MIFNSLWKYIECGAIVSVVIAFACVVLYVVWSKMHKPKTASPATNDSKEAKSDSQTLDAEATAQNAKHAMMHHFWLPKLCLVLRGIAMAATTVLLFALFSCHVLQEPGYEEYSETLFQWLCISVIVSLVFVTAVKYLEDQSEGMALMVAYILRTLTARYPDEADEYCQTITAWLDLYVSPSTSRRLSQKARYEERANDHTGVSYIRAITKDIANAEPPIDLSEADKEVMGVLKKI